MQHTTTERLTARQAVRRVLAWERCPDPSNEHKYSAYRGKTAGGIEVIVKKRWQTRTACAKYTIQVGKVVMSSCDETQLFGAFARGVFNRRVTEEHQRKQLAAT